MVQSLSFLLSLPPSAVSRGIHCRSSYWRRASRLVRGGESQLRDARPKLLHGGSTGRLLRRPSVFLAARRPCREDRRGRRGRAFRRMGSSRLGRRIGRGCSFLGLSWSALGTLAASLFSSLVSRVFSVPPIAARRLPLIPGRPLERSHGLGRLRCLSSLLAGRVRSSDGLCVSTSSTGRIASSSSSSFQAGRSSFVSGYLRK